MILLIFSWLSLISLIICCFVVGFLSFFINGFGEKINRIFGRFDANHSNSKIYYSFQH